MADQAESIVLEHLRTIRHEQTETRADLREIKHRLTSLETPIATLHGDFAGQSLRMDRIETRLERIERRLDLADA